MAHIGGSQARGAKLGATDDTDWHGLCVPPPTSVLGLEREEHFVFTTGGTLGGNGLCDVDVCPYSLMKWTGLAAKGNPSALHLLFAPLEFSSETWDRVSARPHLFLAKGHVKPFHRIRRRPDETTARPEGTEERSSCRTRGETWIRHKIGHACHSLVWRSKRVDR